MRVSAISMYRTEGRKGILPVRKEHVCGQSYSRYYKNSNYSLKKKNYVIQDGPITTKIHLSNVYVIVHKVGNVRDLAFYISVKV